MSVDHRNLVSSEVHEPKHISDSTSSDAGKVITPLSGGDSELRYLSSADLSDGGDLLTEAIAKNNDALNYQGWQSVVDARVTTSTITVDTNETKITIDNEGDAAHINSDYLPLAIRGTGNLWDTTNSKITPINEGDSYEVRLNATVDSFVGTPELITAKLDIGGLSAPTIVVGEKSESASKTAPYVVTFNLPIFCLNTFVTNGGQIFMRTKAGSVNIGERSIFIVRTSSGNN